MYFVSGAIGIIGIAIAFYFHLHNRRAADAWRARLLANPATRWLPTAMENKWYVDEMYHALIRAPLWIFSHALNLFDRYIIDALLINGTARVPRGFGRWFQGLQNGALQSYAVTMLAGIGLLALLVLYMPVIVRLLYGGSP
jgi:NADH-quinone oxidoreductase subunit L